MLYMVILINHYEYDKDPYTPGWLIPSLIGLLPAINELLTIPRFHQAPLAVGIIFRGFALETDFNVRGARGKFTDSNGGVSKSQTIYRQIGRESEPHNGPKHSG